MRFLDDNINIKIIDVASNASLKFKSFLEKSDITYKILDQELSFAPLDWTSSKIQTRMLQNLDLVFDVFSEDRKECIKNYKDLNILIDWLKPKYSKIGELLIPSVQNAFGRIAIDFNGLPKVSRAGGPLKILVSTFNYSTNKEMGFIEVPYNGDEEEQKKLYIANKMKLIPISYKLSIGGQILLSKEDTMIIDDQSVGGGKAAENAILGLPPDATAEQREEARKKYVKTASEWDSFVAAESTKPLASSYYTLTGNALARLEGTPQQKMNMGNALYNLNYWKAELDKKNNDPNYKHIDEKGAETKKDPAERIEFWTKEIRSGKVNQ